MNLKLKDLPSLEVCVKLSSVSFNSPKKNLDVYRLISALNGPQTFFISEHDKILKKFGKPLESGGYSVVDNFEDYKKEINSLMELSIEDDIPKPNITADDFMSCYYPPDKNLWMNASDINAVLSFIQKLK